MGVLEEIAAQAARENAGKEEREKIAKENEETIKGIAKPFLDPLGVVWKDLKAIDKRFKDYTSNNKVGTPPGKAFITTKQIEIADFFKEVLDKLASDIVLMKNVVDTETATGLTLSTIRKTFEKVLNEFTEVIKNRAKDPKDVKEINKIYIIIDNNKNNFNKVLEEFNEKNIDDIKPAGDMDMGRGNKIFTGSNEKRLHI
jgi:hypothetical protein